MTEEPDTTLVTVEGAVPGEWAVKRLFGPLLEEIGEDLGRAYRSGRDRILRSACRKIPDPTDGKRENLRVARDVLWHGGTTTSAVCAEYFGGILASSRSDDGDDDTGIRFVTAVRSLSSVQLWLHYSIYRNLNLVWGHSKPVDVSSDEIECEKLSFVRSEFEHFYSMAADNRATDLGADLRVLRTSDLLSQARFVSRSRHGRTFEFVEVQPTVFGVLLYAAAMNRVADWRKFGGIDLGVMEGLPDIPDIAKSIPELLDADGPFRMCTVSLRTEHPGNLEAIEEQVDELWAKAGGPAAAFSFESPQQPGGMGMGKVTYRKSVPIELGDLEESLLYRDWKELIGAVFADNYFDVEFTLPRR